MSAKLFKSFSDAPAPSSEAAHVEAARQLLEQHAASREAATKAANLCCGACHGSGMAQSEIAGGMVQCWACGGNGAANDKVQSLPALEPEDQVRLYQLGRLLQGPHRAAVLAVVKDYMPDLYRQDGAAH